MHESMHNQHSSLALEQCEVNSPCARNHPIASAMLANLIYQPNKEFYPVTSHLSSMAKMSPHLQIVRLKRSNSVNL